MITCSHDPLCDEGRAYAERLENEGVPVTYMHLSDHMHAFLTMGKFIKASGTVISTMSNALRAHWGLA